jgi:glucose-1-phosphate adenylyltransferase
MINSNANALGIIFPNSYDKTMPEMTNDRLMASIPFASRYRLIDFILSSMVTSGIDNITIMVRENYWSLVDHLGSGREWDLTRKNGGLNIVPPFAMKNQKVFSGRVEALTSIMGFLKRQKEEYVILSDANIAVNFDFKDMLDKHVASGADVTMAYASCVGPKALPDTIEMGRDMYYLLDLNVDGQVTDIKINREITEGPHDLSMNIYIMKREKLIQMAHDAYVDGGVYFERDILLRNLDKLDVRGYLFSGYMSVIYGRKTYYEESMRLLDNGNLDALFKGNPIYTKVRDDNPTRYIGDPKVTNVMSADGCVIEGEVENSILFRGVKIGKGAKVKNAILMQDTIVGEGSEVEYVITDKNVTIGPDRRISGTADYPFYVSKGKNV